MKEGASVQRPPLLDGTNFSYWKARMKAFIKSMDEKAWRAILTGWQHPMKTDDKNEVVKKPEIEWTTEEDRLANSNSKALNAIFSAVDVHQFKLISTCEVAKEAWEILETAHEGTKAVRLSKLQILTSRFENLGMKEDESISQFNSRLCDIANEAFALGEKYSEEKLVRKTLRSLPKRFAYKVTAIEEAKDVQNMKLEELMGSLRTFEMNLDEERGDKKSKGIAFQAENREDQTEDFWNEDDDLTESMVLLSKNFSKVLKKFNRNKGYLRNKNSSSVSTGVPTPRRNTVPNPGNFNAGSRIKSSTSNNNSDSNAKNKGIQCRECEGFGHIQAECANTLKKKNKSLNATWSDEDSDCSKEDETNLVAFASRSDGAVEECAASSPKNTAGVTEDVATPVYESSDDDDLTEDNLFEAYQLIHTKWIELTEICERKTAQIQQSNIEKNNLEKKNSELESKLIESQGSVATLKAELEKMKKLVKMLNSGSSNLDEILSTGKIEKEHFGLGYSRQTGNGQTVFVKGSSSSINEGRDEKGKRAVESSIGTSTVVNPGNTSVATPAGTSGKTRRGRWTPICHYCNKRGHIRPRCFQFFADLRREHQKKSQPRRSTKQEWVKKIESRCNVAFTSLKASTGQS